MEPRGLFDTENAARKSLNVLDRLMSNVSSGIVDEVGSAYSARLRCGRLSVKRILNRSGSNT